MLNLGILLALVCAVVTQLGFLYKHRGANEAPQVDMRHPLRSGRLLFKSKWFAIGMAVATSAWLFHVAALAFAPMSVVQAVLSTGVVMLAVMAERMFGFKVGVRQWIGVGMTAAGLFLLVITLPASTGAHSSYSLAGMIAFESAMLVIGALLISGPRFGAPDHHHGVMLGAAAGVLFGVSDVAIKALTGVAGDGFLAILLSPWIFIAILGSVVGFYASARGLQDGEAVPVIAATSTAANVSCIAGGIIVFGDPMPADVLGIVVQLFAFTMVIVAALVTPAPVARRRRRRCERSGASALQQHPRDLLRVVPGRDVPAAGQRHVARVGQQPAGAGALARVDQQPVLLAPGDGDRAAERRPPKVWSSSASSVASKPGERARLRIAPAASSAGSATAARRGGRRRACAAPARRRGRSARVEALRGRREPTSTARA